MPFKALRTMGVYRPKAVPERRLFLEIRRRKRPIYTHFDETDYADPIENEDITYHVLDLSFPAGISELFGAWHLPELVYTLYHPLARIDD